MSLKPHSATVKLDVGNFIDESVANTAKLERILKSSTQFRSIFKSSLAVDCVFEKMLTPKLNPSLNAARGVIRRIPMLITVGQVAPTYSELRRYLELVGWTVYFSSHPVEWQAFLNNPESPRTNDLGKPIKYCAFRDRLFYSNYAIELLSEEPSGLAEKSARNLSNYFGQLNSLVHGTSLATSRELKPVFDKVDESTLRTLSSLHKKIASDSLIVLAAVFPDRFAILPAMHRGWFDWLVGSVRSKKIRSGSFGI